MSSSRSSYKESDGEFVFCMAFLFFFFFLLGKRFLFFDSVANGEEE